MSTPSTSSANKNSTNQCQQSCHDKGGGGGGVLAPFSGRAAQDYDDGSKTRLQPMKDALHCQLKYAFANRLDSHKKAVTNDDDDVHVHVQQHQATTHEDDHRSSTNIHIASDDDNTAAAAPPPPPHILCVGVGTGEELFYLAKEFPFCHFTALDISDDMIQQCRIKATQLAIAMSQQQQQQKNDTNHVSQGLLDRIHFHTGTVASLPDRPPTTTTTSSLNALDSSMPYRYDGATSILVSQYITDRQEREAFFWEISKRLKSGGVLFHVDLALDQTGLSQANQDIVWQSWIASNAIPTQNMDRLRSAMNNKTKIAFSEPKDIEQMICQQGGFHPPVQVFQWILAHGWICEAKE